MVLTKDALGLRPRRPLPRAQRLQAHREVAKLVLREEEREAKAFVVVLAPHPRPAHVQIGKVDRRMNELLDCLSDGGHVPRPPPRPRPPRSRRRPDRPPCGGGRSLSMRGSAGPRSSRRGRSFADTRPPCASPTRRPRRRRTRVAR